MPDLAVMSWNIQVFGLTKGFASENNLQLINMVGAIAANFFRLAPEQARPVDVLCLQEVMSCAVEDLAPMLGRAVASACGEPYSVWWVQARPHGNRESLVYVTRDATVSVLGRPANAPRVAPARWGSTDARRQFPANPAFDLVDREFPQNGSLTHGRLPAYLCFLSGDRVVSAVNYHAPPAGAAAAAGMECFYTPQLLPELATVAVDGHGQVGVQVPILAGDWNLDFTAFTNGYDLAARTGTQVATAERTHLRPVSGYGAPIEPYPQATADYRNLAIDDVLAPTGPANVVGRGAVFDVLQAMRTGGLLSTLAGGFRPHGVAGNVRVPPVSAVEAFLLARSLVSDHLPVGTLVRL